MYSQWPGQGEGGGGGVVDVKSLARLADEMTTLDESMQHNGSVTLQLMLPLRCFS